MAVSTVRQLICDATIHTNILLETQIESTTDRQTSSIRATMSTSAPPTSCRYQGPKGVIDLTSVGRTDGTASFLNVSAGPASSYSE